MLNLATNVRWDEIDGDVFQKSVVDDPLEAGKQFTFFSRIGRRW